MSCSNWLRQAIRAVIVSLSISLVPLGAAQLHRINTVSIGPHRRSWSLLDLSGFFEQQVMAVTRSGDLLIFSANPNGRWELQRVRGWDKTKVQLQHLDLPGYFSISERHNLEALAANLFITPDGKYAVCVASAEWLKRIHGKAVGRSTTDNMITVADLHSFKIANEGRTKEFNLYGAQGVTMDNNGRLVIDSLAPWPEHRGAFIPLKIPSLEAEARCEYRSLLVKPGEPEHLAAVTSDSCSKDLKSTSVEEYLRPTRPEFQHKFTCQDTHAEYCPEPTSFTPDRRFGFGVRTEGHDNFLGSWVETSATAVAFSMHTHTEIGEIDLMHGNPNLLLTSVGAHDYLLVLRHGSELTVYALMDPSSHSAP